MISERMVTDAEMRERYLKLYSGAVNDILRFDLSAEDSSRRHGLFPATTPKLRKSKANSRKTAIETQKKRGHTPNPSPSNVYGLEKYAPNEIHV